MAASRRKPSPDLAARVGGALTPYLHAGDVITVGFSGGLDSTVLLHLLARLAPQFGFTLRAAHVHHGLQTAADAWPAHCAAICAELGVPFTLLHVAVDRAHPQGIEAAARAVRHAALRKLGGDWLALAHHRGDQAETLLHRLTRGSGVQGAAAMRIADTRNAPPALLRPLLNEPRSELVTWAQAQNLTWIEDPSNSDTAYSRNFIRYTIMAPLQQRFPGAEAALARAAEHFGEAAELLGALAAIDYTAVQEGKRARRSTLLSLSDARLANLLRQRLAARHWLAPDARQLEEALRQLRSAQPPWHARFDSWALCAQDDEVWIEPADPPSAPGSLIWRGEAQLDWGVVRLHFLPADAGAGLGLIPGRAELRPRSGGERIQPDPRRPARDLKTLAREHGVPSWLRDLIPVIWNAEKPVWYAGAAECKAPGNYRIEHELLVALEF
ncbi:MAG: tRNA lysidine(34) synthetase TilS [Betaproteobacteria bacterium]|nr:tRNA lysidine(34) synthetase TilS [Betaproteobacteria bacterium]